MRATLVPYSSVVEQIITLHDEQGRLIGQLGLYSVMLPGLEVPERTPLAYKNEMLKLAQFVADAINKAEP